MERADLIAALLTGMRRAEDFRAQAAAYRTAHSEQMEHDHGKAADAELVLSLFAFTPDHLKLLGSAGIEALGEIVCHAWALNGGNNEALIRWFREPMNALDGQIPASMVRAGRLQVLLLVLRQQAQWELPRRSA
ncbi:antitoxin Xre/MbcA/ParS toxin-binding domain-containing protein [Xanthomonas campestris pv. incanae]|uniref:antitoxin Xre/MbcA/ParS toxin-binding domain-containing protein n=1 Tax=Xanthomonas campestris TaxID=339 RepID=UPI0029C59F18|nr:antitoxin Xre/MbcA/ParS toxin-binding domain-containing protein [Xanthomonas campestris]MDX6081299.1 antitoxin Xre/MbcA/ParS toxin-binding domain-containing protein [Xanthomonas campestris pv. incanae]MDX6085922.1 antitoxin Xre/MbcA/ParS toxin-binding domain-containing protein [Xanthomonas campestris pv. incanae]MDX6139178.1 antitoxin Xre/MbcA/ParS toxin-binding domain-containing protein [Xanthomonas campestris pv. incanae]